MKNCLTRIFALLALFGLAAINPLMAQEAPKDEPKQEQPAEQPAEQPKPETPADQPKADDEKKD